MATKQSGGSLFFKAFDVWRSTAPRPVDPRASAIEQIDSQRPLRNPLAAGAAWLLVLNWWVWALLWVFVIPAWFPCPLPVLPEAVLISAAIPLIARIAARSGEQVTLGHALNFFATDMRYRSGIRFGVALALFGGLGRIAIFLVGAGGGSFSPLFFLIPVAEISSATCCRVASIVLPVAAIRLAGRTIRPRRQDPRGTI